MAVVLALTTVIAGEPAKAPSSIGLTRDQVVARYGEPKSQIAAGNRLVMFFAKERLVLRDGVVIEVERLASEPVRRPPDAAPVAATTAPAAVAPTPVPTAAPVAPVPMVPDSVAGVAPPPPTPEPPATAPALAAAQPVQPSVAPEPKLEIKLVRPPSAKYVRPLAKQEAPSSASPISSTSPVGPAAETTAGREPVPVVGRAPVAEVTARPIAPKDPVASTTLPAGRGFTVMPSRSDQDEPATKPETDAKPAEEDPAEKAAAMKAEKEKKKKLNAAKARRREAEADAAEPDIAEAFLTGRTIVIALIVVGGGIGYLIWRSRQRRLEMAASAVSHSPFNATASPTGSDGAVFSADLLARLEWKRFEELVADYYVKTGVVAVRTKSGPTSPVHIKISWKGEPRPFACVHCIAHPRGLVDVKPLQDLMSVLSAEDIRRGYVVSTGKFSVNARDYAEEKHLTLLPGDIFLEKINALPEGARNDIMQAISTGDNQTPSCPKCDAKMVPSSDDPAMWRCAAHADQLIPVWT